MQLSWEVLQEKQYLTQGPGLWKAKRGSGETYSTGSRSILGLSIGDEKLDVWSNQTTCEHVPRSTAGLR
jgi:hypothetical protein